LPRRGDLSRVLATFVLLLGSCTPACAQDARPDEEAEASEPYVPVDLDDAIRHLKETLPPEDIEFLKTASEGEIVRLHSGFGMGLRNGWGLWAGSRLAEWFNSIGIYHPDDMSAIVTDSLVRELRGEPIELEAQVARYQAFWAEAKKREDQREKLADRERQKRRERAGLNWDWKRGSASEVTLPRQPDWHEVWGLHKYDRGFLVVAKRYRRSYQSVWHDGVYFLDSPEGSLERVDVSGCLQEHDLIVRDDSATWLCRSMEGDWTLVTIAPGRTRATRKLTLDTEHDWLRLGQGQSGLLLVGADKIYREKGQGWEVIYRAPHPTRDFNLFDQDGDFDADENPDPFLPHRSATPIEHGQYVYFLVEDPGNDTELYRLDLSGDDSDLENVRRAIVQDLIGNYDFRASDMRLDESGRLWISGSRPGVLLSVGPDGAVSLASIFHNLKFKGPLDEIEPPGNWRRKLPTGAILHDGESILLAGVDGVAKVVDRKVEPVVRFVYPDGMDREPFTSRPQYDYHLQPQRLGRFDDGSFVIGDRHNGVYVLVKDKDGYRLKIPGIARSIREIGR